MGFLEALKDLLSGATCHHLIIFNGHTLEFKSLSTEYGGAKFSIGNFKADVKKIREASEMAQSIDAYQYDMCNLRRELKKDDPDRKVLLMQQAGALGLFYALRNTLRAFDDDRSGEANNLRDIVKTMQDYTVTFAKKVSERYGTLDEVGEQEVQKAEVLTRSFALVGVTEEDVQRLIDEL